MGSIAQRFPKHLLDLVFGDGSAGGTPQERAVSSKHFFVRSQVQIAFASPGAKGRVLSAYEALQTFGWDVLLEVAVEGSATLVRSMDEPASTLKSQRTALALSLPEVAKRTGVSKDEIELAETSGNLTSIRVLDALGQALALDERRLGYQPGAGGDSALGVRLRELRQAGDIAVFGPNTVLDLAEAAWVIARQAYLAKALGFRSSRRVEMPGPNSDYRAPSYKVGYQLAEQTRRLLGLDSTEPVESLRGLIEDVLELPLIQQTLDARFAGATIANGDVRGIVINEKGMNSNVWVRRMTLCHELGHLLWDPDAHLAKLKVDEYSGIDGNAGDSRRDPVETRANAFAVAFLAPADGVNNIANQCNGVAGEVVAEVMTRYGIGATAAKNHVHNITRLETAQVPVSSLPLPGEDWIAREDLTIAYFPVSATPISRRGKFSWFVARMFSSGLLSEDTASTYLKCDRSELAAHLETILAMWEE